MPFLLALVVHFLAFFFVDKNWDESEEISADLDFKTIKAELIVIGPSPPTKYNSDESVLMTPRRERQPLEDQTQPKTPPMQKEIKAKEVKHKTDPEDLENEPALNKEVLGNLSKTGFESTLLEEAIALNESTNRRVANSYQAKIYNQVRSNWSRPPSARNGMQTKLLVELIPTGEVMSVSIIESSGVLAFDRSAEQAVKRSRKFEVPGNNQLFEEYFRRFYFLFKPEDLLR